MHRGVKKRQTSPLCSSLLEKRVAAAPCNRLPCATVRVPQNRGPMRMATTRKSRDCIAFAAGNGLPGRALDVPNRIIDRRGEQHTARATLASRHEPVQCPGRRQWEIKWYGRWLRGGWVPWATGTSVRHKIGRRRPSSNARVGDATVSDVAIRCVMDGDFWARAATDKKATANKHNDKSVALTPWPRLAHLSRHVSRTICRCLFAVAFFVVPARAKITSMTTPDGGRR